MAPDHARIEAIARRRALPLTSRCSASLRSTSERSGSNVAALAMTRHILMRNGIAVPQVVARCCEEQDAGHEIDDQADRDGTEDPAEGGQGNVSADAEQTQVEHPARADQHRHSHGVKRQHGRLSPHRGRLVHPDRERKSIRARPAHPWTRQ